MNDAPLLLVDTVACAVRAYAGLLLVVAAMAKLRDRSGFVRIVAAYRILPERLTEPAARTLPAIELLLGAALLVPGMAGIAAPAAAAMLALFAAAVAVNLARGRRELDCGCGTGARIGWSLVLGNLGIAAVLVATMSAAGVPLLLFVSGTILGLGLRVCHLVLGTLAAMPIVRRLT